VIGLFWFVDLLNKNFIFSEEAKFLVEAKVLFCVFISVGLS
jgi:hypothetical protein